MYEYIVRHFIATVSPNCELNETTVRFEIGSEIFKTSGKIVTFAGFTEVKRTQVSETNFPEITEGATVNIQSINVTNGQTERPDFLTESDLIALVTLCNNKTFFFFLTHKIKLNKKKIKKKKN